MRYIFEQTITTIDTNISSEEIFENTDEAQKQFYKSTEIIRQEILPKFIDSKNLNLLLGTGTSVYSGANVINSKKKNNFKDLSVHEVNLQKKIDKILDENRIEDCLDKISQIKAYYEVIGDIRKAEKIEKYLDKLKSTFLERYVLTIDYTKNIYHKSFLKKIVSRKPSLNRVNIFTTNYDLLIERSAEEMGIQINNGFSGFQKRAFNPSNFYLDFYVNSQDDKGKKYNRSINLFKLHGSLSWSFDDTCPPYGISEKQIYTKDDKVNLEENISCIIYPIQSKKKVSLDLPYSELFRKFVESLNRSDTVLIVMGYSFWDEHINDLISNALCNPDFNLLVFAYSEEGTKSSPYLNQLFSLSKMDKRITIFEGDILGNFGVISQYLLPFSDEINPFDEAFGTYKVLKNKDQL
jgi:hypothetical protein